MLAVSHVRKDFGSVRAVRDVSFTIPTGSTFGLLGPNGAGKTTTMRTILGIYVPDGGTVTWNGRSVDGTLRRKHFGYLPEERGLYGKMKVREQIEYFARLHGMTDPRVRPAVDDWIDRLGLSGYAGRPCAELSKGNQQKVQVACAAAHAPELLILDEPFSGLDPVNAEMLLKTLSGLQAQGATLVLSSHQMWQLEELCDAFCIITAGENRASGTLDELRAHWPTRTVKVEPATPAARAVLERVPGAQMMPPENGSLLVEVPRATLLPPILRQLVSAEAITRFEAVDPSLQDIYIKTISEGTDD